MIDRELNTINLSGELSGLQLGGVGIDSKVLTQAEVDGKIAPLNSNISTNATNITNLQAATVEHDRQLNMDTSKLGVNINDILETGYYEVNTGLPYGLTAGGLRVGYDTQNPTRVIQEYVDLHEAAGYRRQYNGSAFTPWEETPQSKFNDDSQLFAVTLSQTKADVSYVNNSIINTYTGVTPPDSSLGKNGDEYHQYATEAPLDAMLVGNSITGYTQTGVFGLFFDPVATGPQYLAINAETREIFFEYGSDGFPSVNDIVLSIDGHEVTTTIASQTSVGVTLSYLNTFDPIIALIVVGTPFEVLSKGLSGSETDYTKAQNRWYLTPIYDNTYDHVGSQGAIVQDIGFTELVRLTTPDREAGTFQITFNVNATYSSTTSSMRFRYSIDGGQQWSPTVWKEPKDTSDAFVLTDTFVYMHSGGVFDAIIQGACESATQTLTANFANIIIEAKG